MNQIERYSPSLRELLTPIFGKNCNQLSRSQAFSLMDAATEAAKDKTTGRDFKFLSCLKRRPDLSTFVAKIEKIDLSYSLDDLTSEELLGLVSYLSMELRYGFWTSTKDQIDYLASKGKYHWEYFGENLENAKLYGELDNGLPFYFEGDLDFILGLLQHSRSHKMPSAKKVYYALSQAEQDLFSLNYSLKKLLDYDEQDSKYFEAALSQQEKYSWEDSMRAFSAKVQEMRNLVIKRLAIAEQNYLNWESQTKEDDNTSQD